MYSLHLVNWCNKYSLVKFHNKFKSFNKRCGPGQLLFLQSLFTLPPKMSAFELFKGTPDIHNGINIDSTQEPCLDVNEFKQKLEGSMKQWNDNGIRGVWFNVALKDAAWLPVLAENGFRVHRGSGETVVLCKWLPKDVESKIPHYAHTNVGAGAIVVNGKNQILVVCERYRNIPYWKLPGGYIEPGEDIGIAAQREVEEETGIKTEYLSIISFRHSLKFAAFGCSDIYFVVELKPLGEEITEDRDEIEASKWMNIEEYLQHPMVHENNRLFVRKYLDYKAKYLAIERNTQYHPITKKPQAVYSIGHLERCSNSSPSK